MNRRQESEEPRIVLSRVAIIVAMALVAFGVARGAAGLMLGSGDLLVEEHGLSAQR